MFVQAAQSNPGGMSPTGMAKLVQIESGGRAGIVNGSGHAGLIQAGPAYWSRFGQGSPLDPNQAIAALGRSTASDAAAFRSKLGRDPTDAELYIAHQQGLGGALALMRNPDMPAAHALVAGGAYKSLDTARIAIRANGGNPDAPAQAFVNMWTGKFTGAGMPSITPGGGQTMTHAARLRRHRLPTFRIGDRPRRSLA